MYSISRDIRAACGASTPGNLSNNKSHRNQFLRDYYKQIKPYLSDPFADEIPKPLSVEELLLLAGEEFNNFYGLFPTCAVYAPGCLAVAGKSTGLAESKSLSMAVQLVTLIVGKRSRGCKWCHVKTLSDEIAGEKVTRFYLNSENLDLSGKEASWIRYVKATIQSFKAKRAYVPGFEIVIASNVPVKSGLGSSSALVVALYTFLEAITNTYTGNVLEKTLACHLAEKLAAGSSGPRLVDTLTSVIGNEDKIFACDTRSLNIHEHDWNLVDAELILVECPNVNIDSGFSGSRSDATRRKAIMTVMNTTSRWRTHPAGTSMMERMFPEETKSMTRDVVNEDERISRMISTIEMERLDQLGKLLWENYHSARKYMNSLPDDIERIMTVLETTEGVLGANVISRGYGAAIVALVQRSRSKMFISLLSRMKISQRCHKIESFVGASVLYSYERVAYPWNSPENRYRAKLMTKYHLRYEDDSQLGDGDNFNLNKAISLHIPHAAVSF